MRVSHVMSTDIVTVTRDDRAWTAADLLMRLELGALPVVNGGRRVLGIVTQADLISALVRGADLMAVTVAQVMRPAPAPVEPDTELAAAAAVLDGGHLLPVCRDGRLVGVLAPSDILRGMMLCCLQRPVHPVASPLAEETAGP
jgi:CBS-domain-containing membrane protein